MIFKKLKDLKSFERLEKKASEVGLFLIQKQQTLAVAESCTGGLISYSLSLKPGASQFFLGSVVSYSYLSKIKDLGVDARLLQEKGAVNSKVCSLMAQGVRKKWNSDWALAVTGVAGPDQFKVDPPIGTVFFKFLGPGVEELEQILLENKNRKDIQHQSAIFALDFLSSRFKMATNK